MKKAKKEDKELLNPNEWLQNHGDFLFSFTMARIYSTEIAEDIVQDTFVSAFEARDKFKGNSSERTWLVSILKRKIIDHYRKSSKNQQTSLDLFEKPFYQDGLHEGTWVKEKVPQNWNMDFFQEMDREEFFKIFQYCLSLLPEKVANCFSMKSVDELETKEICKVLQISASNLWVMLHRARLQLRECMEKNWLDEKK